MTTPRLLTIAPLTIEAFAPFGEVIDTSQGSSFLINNSTTERFHALARVQLFDDDSDRHSADTHAILSIFRAQPRALPFTIQMVEKHPYGSQAFMPLSQLPYLVVVASGGAVPEALHAFYARPDQGVNYRAGVWHHPLIALFQTSDFLVVDRQGTGTNCIEYELPEQAYLSLPSTDLAEYDASL